MVIKTYRDYFRYYFRQCLSENRRFQIIGDFYNRIHTNEKVVALTYDDGPLDPYTQDLLAVLKKHDVPATFFFIGKRIEEFRETAKLAHEQGHQIANHSYTHQKFSRKSLAFTYDEINKTDQLIRSLGVDYEIVFRAPHVNKFLVLPYALWRLKKKHVMFDFYPNPRDWWGSDPNAVAQSVVDQSRPGSIIVLHDGNLKSAPLICQYTELLIPKMKEQGYRFVTVQDLLKLNSAN